MHENIYYTLVRVVWGFWLSIGWELLYRGLAILGTFFVWELLSWSHRSLLGDLYLVELLWQRCALFLSCLLWMIGYFTDWFPLLTVIVGFAFPASSLLRDSLSGLLEILLSWYLLSLRDWLSWELVIRSLLYKTCFIREFALRVVTQKSNVHS